MYTVTNWPNRDPIEEAGGINLYVFVKNDGFNQWDFLGLAEESFSDSFIEKLVADWYDKVITREIREKSYKKRSYDTQNCCCNIETHHISDHQDTTVKRLSVKDITITVTATSSIDTSHLVGDWIATLAGLMPIYGNMISVANQVKNTFVDTTNVSFDVSTSEGNEYEIEKVDSEQKTQWFNAYHRISGPYCDNTISSADCTDDPDPAWTYSEKNYN